MSQPENKQPSEEEVMKVMRDVLSTDYGLCEEDKDAVLRMMQYGSDKTGLTKEEISILQERGLMDKDGLFAIPTEFFFRGLVLPSFWIKCLMALQGMINFSTPKAVVKPQ